MKGLPGMGDCLLPGSTIMPRFPSSMRSTTSPRKPPNAPGDADMRVTTLPRKACNGGSDEVNAKLENQ